MYKSNGKLSILHLILAVRETSAPYNEHCLPLADKHHITICTFFKSDIKTPNSISLFEGDGSTAGFVRVLKSAIEVKKYDVIHVHSPHLGLLFLSSTLFVKKKLLSSTVITVHDSYPNYKLRNQLMFMPVFASFERVICCSQSSYESFPAIYKRLAGPRIGVVQNGLDIARVDRIDANDQGRPPSSSDFTVTAISRLVDIKNPFTILTAFQESADQISRLVYIGDGPLREHLLTKRIDTGIENQIEFTGLIPRNAVFKHLTNTDLFISASRGEGLPVSVLEAMASGIPVLLSDIPPHREIATGVNFVPLIDPDDIAGFAREIKRFRELSDSERKDIGKKCRALVEARFSLDAMHAGYAKVYAQIKNNEEKRSD